MKKKIVLAVIALLILAVLGAGGMFALKWYSGQNAAKAAAAAAVTAAPAGQPGAAKDDDDEDEPAPAAEGEGAAPPPVLMLGPLIVNLTGPRTNAFLKCDLSVLFRDQDLGKLATSDKPTPENSIIRALVLEALSGKTVEEASDVEARETLRQDIKDKLNARFASRMKSKEALEKAKKSGKPVKPPIREVLVIDWAIQQ